MQIFSNYRIFLYLNIDPDMIEKAGDGLLLKLRSLYAHAKELADTEVKYVSVFPFSTCI